MHVVECRHELDGARSEHPVAENVPAHITDTNNGEVVLVDVDAEVVKVMFDALPRPPGGDPDFLVVVADTASGSERVTEPKAVVPSHQVGGIGQMCRPLVSSHDEVRIVVVMANDLGRMDNVSVDHVVGDIEKA